MASKTQTPIVEKEYVIPLRKEWSKVSRHKRTAKSIKAIKKFIARHMNIRDRDNKKVKLDVYLNNEVWFRGGKNPPSKIKVKAIKEGDIVRVDFVDIPDKVKFDKTRQEKKHEKAEKKKAEKKPEEKADSEKEKSEEKKKEEEKEKSVEKANIKLAEQAAKAQKHTIKGKEPVVQRKALKK